MKDHDKTDFDEKAATWDANSQRVKLANDVADAIIREMKPTRDMDALDYGCGSGLVTLRIQPHIRNITGIDSSKVMLEVIQAKVEKLGLINVRTQFVDFERGGKAVGMFHLIVSSMTFHHVNEPALLLRQLYDLLLPGGCLGIADLDKEDGSFHNDNTGVLHFGFERAYLKGLFGRTGLREVRDITAATVVKEIEGKGRQEFPVFLIIGRK